MTNQVAVVMRVKDGDDRYHSILLWCPGCQHLDDTNQMVGGLNSLPISGNPDKRPTWTWNGNLEAVTLSPSILCKVNFAQNPFVCHSFLENGMWRFLEDCTHDLAGQIVPMIPLPDWVTRD